jgi:phage FluMu gp28-like protein
VIHVTVKQTIIEIIGEVSLAQLNFTLHDKQMEIYNDKHRFKVVCCGRRFGKTRLCSYIVIIRALLKAEQVIWIVSPKYAQTAILWRMLKKYLPRSHVKDVKEGDMVIELTNGSTIWAKSADNPDALVGEGLDLLILDEAARVKPEAWEVALQPALADKKGEAIFISTPKGRNWYYNLYLRGLGEDPEYKSFNFPSSCNTSIPDFDEEIEKRRKSMPELIFRQEFMAEFISSGGEVFQDIREILDGRLCDPVKGKSYVMGVDLAKHVDFTVLTVADITNGQVVYWERFNQIDWQFQRDKIEHVAKLFNDAVIYIDSTGVGDPIVEDLQRKDLIISPYKFTVNSKYDLVKNLNIMIKARAIHIPRNQTLIDEMGAYTYEMLPSGVIRYGAPDGMHDDCVTSLMLCAWGLSKNRTEVVGEMDKIKVGEGDISDYGIREVDNEDESKYINWYDNNEGEGSLRQQILRSLG